MRLFPDTHVTEKTLAARLRKVRARESRVQESSPKSVKEVLSTDEDTRQANIRDSVEPDTHTSAGMKLVRWVMNHLKSS